MKPISSPHNPRFKAALQLARQRGRKQQDRFLVHGAREIERALEARVAFDECFVCSSRIDADEAALVSRCDTQGIPVWDLPPDLFDRVRYGDTPASVIAVARPPHRELNGLVLGRVPLVVVVERVEKPGNLGAILRTTDAVAADAVLLVDPLVDVFHPNVIRASTGCVFSQPIVSASAEAVLAWLAASGLAVWAASLEAETTYTEVDLRRPVALVFGNEAGGLRPIWQGAGVRRFRLPMLGVADSLNVSVTAAVMLFEARRQRSI